MSGLFQGGPGYPLAGPLGLSRGACNPRSHAASPPVAPMTLSVPLTLSCPSLPGGRPGRGGRL
jgi:hypothetical protein